MKLCPGVAVSPWRYGQNSTTSSEAPPSSPQSIFCTFHRTPEHSSPYHKAAFTSSPFPICS